MQMFEKLSPLLAALLVGPLAGACDDGDERMDAGRDPDTGPPPSAPVTAVGLELVADGFTSPVALHQAPGETDRLFVVEQMGTISVVRDGDVRDAPFLDLRDRIVELRESFDERGLLGLAFHPRYAENGRLFVYYSAPLRAAAPDDYDHTARISEITVTDPSADVADFTERVLLEVDEPQFNHDGGTVAFGPDGYLYIALGDGGAANDVGLGHPEIGNGQDITTLLGSILRIDVDGGQPYAIPTDNPFVGREGRDEIYAYGFRNPFRFSFDMGGANALFAGDAGQNRFEEIDRVVRGGNYGWNIREGTHCFDPENPDTEPESCPAVGARGEPLRDPILEYANIDVPGGIGTAVIAGFVYRGDAIPGLVGEYVFGDFSGSGSEPEGRLFAATPPNGAPNEWTMRELRIANREGGDLRAFVLSFGQDAAGEIYLMVRDPRGPTGQTGRVYRLVPAEDAQPLPPPPEEDAGAGPMDAGVPADAGPDPVAAQRTRGMSLFATHCARCHGADGMGTALAPALVGPGALPLDPPPSRMLRTGQFRTARDVYDFASVNMPFDMPGTLDDQTYIDVVAFALFANGVELEDELTIANSSSVVINP